MIFLINFSGKCLLCVSKNSKRLIKQRFAQKRSMHRKRYANICKAKHREYNDSNQEMFQQGFTKKNIETLICKPIKFITFANR